MGDIHEFKPKRPGCSCSADGSVEGCYHHDPKRQGDRKRNATKAAKGKANRKVAALWDEVRGVIGGVLSGRIQPPQANSALRGFATLISLARLELEQAELEISNRRLELDIQERTELLARLEELEQLMAARKDRPWGA